uniref:LytTR family transcriptional regulator DNA-binding domain-containing protein n=1 Tax=Alloprevotella sp. TaxID=1872471 RepID=UPI004025B74A
MATISKKNQQIAHFSYLINLNHIRELNRSSIVLDTGAEIPVGDTYRAAVNEFISRLSVGK